MGHETFYDSRGAPHKITKQRTEAFCQARSIGMAYYACALYAGVSPETPKNWMAAGKRVLKEMGEAGESGEPMRELSDFEKAAVDFQLAVWEAEAAASATWQQTINNAAQIDPEWAWKMLERWYPDEYQAPATKVQHTGADGDPIQHEVKSTVQIFIPDNGREKEMVSQENE